MAVTVNMTSPVSDPGNGVTVTGNIVTISSPLVDYIIVGTTAVNKLVVSGAVSVTLSTLSITSSTANAPVSVTSGTVNMRITGTNRLESTGGSAALGKAGLEILQNASVILEEDLTSPGGELTSVGGFGSAGIGSSVNTLGGSLTIESGAINAIGYTTITTIRLSGAGIGAGASTLAAGASFGLITINGGTITASGGNVGSNGGAGIGAGHANVGSSVVEGIVINGGNVTAKGADFTTNNSGAGIGAACAGANAISRVGSITINGVNTIVNATGGSIFATTGNSSGSGIGSSWVTAAGGESSVGDITINNGLIRAVGGTVANFTGSGIGAAGVRFAAISQVSHIFINGGTIEAIGGTSVTSVDTSGGSGIGSGFASGGGTSSAGNITIAGGNITASASPLRQGGSGIGAGSAQGTDSTSVTGQIEITAGVVRATGSEFGAGIGTGGILRLAVSNVAARTGDIVITSGTVTAIGVKNSPGIGPGTASANALCFVSNILISGGTIVAKGSTDTSNTPGGAGIGTGFAVGGTCQVGAIEITNGAVIAEATSGFSGAGIGTGGATFAAAKGVSLVDRITIENATIHVAASGGHPINDSGVGIGAAYALSSGVSRVNVIQIVNSTLEQVLGSLNSAAIGSGRADFDQSQSSVGSITITGSTFGQVIGGNFGAGIGSGNGMEGNCASVIGTFQGTDPISDYKNWALGSITITNSTFHTIAALPYGDAASVIAGGTGIGSGATAARIVTSKTNGISKVGTIELDNVTITAITGGLGAPGIGSAYSTNGGESRVDTIILRNSVIESVRGGFTRSGSLSLGPGIGTGYVNDFRLAETLTPYSFGGTSTIDLISIENTRIGGAYGGEKAPGIGASFTENLDSANNGVIVNRSQLRLLQILNQSNVTAYGGLNANGIGISEIAFSARTPSDPVIDAIKGSSYVDILHIDATSRAVAYAINFPGVWTGIPNSAFVDAVPPIAGTFTDDVFNQRDQLWTGLKNANQFDSESEWLSIGGWTNTPGSTPDANIVNSTFYKGRETDGVNGINAIDTTQELRLVSIDAVDSIELVIPPLYKYVGFTGEDPNYFFRITGGPYQNQVIVDRHTTLNLSNEPFALANVASETILRLKVLQTRLSVTYFANTESVGFPELTSGAVPTDETVYTNDNFVEVQENPNAMVLTGFVFSGWSLNDNGQGLPPIYQNPSIPPSERNREITGSNGLGIQEDQNLYAVWEPEVPIPPIVIIDVEPKDVPLGSNTTVTITVQNISNVTITKQLRTILPRGFVYLIDSLTINNEEITLQNINNVLLDLGVNEPGEIDVIRFRLRAPLRSRFRCHKLRSLLRSTIGEVRAEAEICLEEEEE
ncbi:hypothetical protein [Paenibacillus sp. CF384]|uniref:beta strand repeat-containing protein n=1 Tax=Paenibacillus sp. CF384 TaxID=1884382 RepID=UPI0008967EC4|nr:hypothetical protein [Paenibacillus sp. CF384]SDW55766.1 hypothetical protein SAMN05518855_100379 [Paenibacillus sp. CF384]